jgi:hypothetical protein
MALSQMWACFNKKSTNKASLYGTLLLATSTLELPHLHTVWLMSLIYVTDTHFKAYVYVAISVQLYYFD